MNYQVVAICRPGLSGVCIIIIAPVRGLNVISDKEFLTRSPGHMRDWLRACKGGDPACSNFSVAGPYAEWVTLGAIAYHFEGKLEWDAASMQFTNNKEANEYVKPRFRKGWEIEL